MHELYVLTISSLYILHQLSILSIVIHGSFFVLRIYFNNMMRRRNENNDSDHDALEPFVLKMSNQKSNLPSAEDLLSTDPKPFSGYCLKKNNSILAYLFPCWFPVWKKRYFILVGNYLFRYSDEFGDIPKGVPIPLDSCQVAVVETNEFEVSTIRKVYRIRTNSDEECNNWIKAIRLRKSQSIRENMGHAPISKKVGMANKVGDRLFKDRLKQDYRDTESRQMILNPLNPINPSS